jgi:hypothetical protein
MVKMVIDMDISFQNRHPRLDWSGLTKVTFGQSAAHCVCVCADAVLIANQNLVGEIKKCDGVMEWYFFWFYLY